MRHPEGYCWWCGNWQELPFFNAVCRKCTESKQATTRLTAGKLE